MAETVKGIERLLTLPDLKVLLGKPPQFIREKLLLTGILKGFKLGGNSWRVTPAEYERFIRSGATGFKHALPSGQHKRREKWARHVS